jgi:hypothetical protein
MQAYVMIVSDALCPKLLVRHASSRGDRRDVCCRALRHGDDATPRRERNFREEPANIFQFPD